jgi:two-component system C4-dicarboxylate transport sensor histidine kinase DctB
MTSGTALTKKYWRLSAFNIVIALIIGVVAIVSAARFASDITEADLRAKANETLSVQAETLTGLLDKYRLLSVVLANRDDVANLLINPKNKNISLSAQKITSRAAAASGALDVVLASASGENIASGLTIATQPLETNLPIMVAALEGRLGRGVQVLGNNNRAYVFTSGVRLEEDYVGVIAVYVGLNELEANWSLSSMPIFATDERKIIVMSNKKEWLLREFDFISTSKNNQAYFEIEEEKKEYFDISRKLPLLDWELHVLVDIAPMKNASILWGGLAGFFVLLVAIGTQMLINRGQEVSRRERRDKATSLRLERIVRDRTGELVSSNASLASEVEERRQTEEQLRKTQNELVQTGKLAALGQMSTSLSHEYNQPLSATKSYADNALKYLKLNRIEEAAQNITRISGLADRMAEISKHLRNFARKPNSSFDSILLKPVIDETLELMSARIKSLGVDVEMDMVDKDILVRAGHVRLQQVMVNLISNALDAVSEVKNPLILIKVREEKLKVIIQVIDNGHGIEKDKVESIFDPFFTTKEVGKGLGLGLSISFNIIKDFGGRLFAHNIKSGGAEFSIILDQGKGDEKAS